MQGERTQDWDRLAALGAYLGIADAWKLAEQSASHPGAARLLEAISETALYLAGKFSPDAGRDLLEAMATTDFTILKQLGNDREERLSRDLYWRLTNAPFCHDDLPPFDVFNRHVREYLHRFAVSFTAAGYGMGIRKEIISLENPAIRESVEEIRLLPCRSFGAAASQERKSAVSASLADYVHALIDRRSNDMGTECKEDIIDILDHMAAYPGYYRQIDAESKAEKCRTLVSVISALQRADDSPERSDLLASLCILLFNIYPSPAIVRYLAINRPGRRNKYLEYEYNAILAMNFMLMGKEAAAAGYCRRACETAPDPDLKAYAHMLEGCIALDNRDYRIALTAFEKGMESAGRRGLRSLGGFYLGIVRYEAGETGQAINYFRDAQIGAEAEADAMAACNNMGTCHMVLGDLAKALRAFEESASMGTYSGRASVKLNRSVAVGNSGIVYMSMREPELAREQFTNALRAARETGNVRSVADQLMNLGLTFKSMGDYDAASSHFISAMNYSYTIDYLEGVLYSRNQISQALALQGKHDEEEDIYREIVRRHPGIRKLLMR